MWWLFLFLIAACTNEAFLSTETSNNSYAGLDSLEETDFGLLNNRLDEIVDSYLQYFADAQLKSPKRQKRQVTSNDKSTLLIDKTGAYRLQALKPLISLCSPAIKIEFITIYNDTFAVCLSAVTRDETPAMVHLGQVTLDNWREIESWYVSNPEDVALLYDNGILNILVADSTKENGLDLFRYDFRNKRLILDHTVHGRYPTAVTIWKMKVDGTYHMAVANSAGNKDAFDLITPIYTYGWTGTYFDQYSEIVGYDVKDIEAFHIHGAAYLAVANFKRGKYDFKVDSEVFKYSLDENRWFSHQKIRTYQAMDFEFFTLGQGTGKEFFLAVANYAQSDEQTVSSVVYKFVKDIFVPFQCLESYGATSISSLTDGHKFLLAVANNDILHLYQYDGWKFVQSSVQYTQRLSLGVNDLSFHHVGANNTLVLAISNTDSQYMNEPSLFEVVFVHENSLEKWYDESSEWCQSKIDDLSNPKITGLEDIENVFFVDQTDPIVISGNVHFANGAEVAKITTPKLIDSSNKMVYDTAILGKLRDLDHRLNIVAEKIKNIQDVYNRALKLDGKQTVKAKYNFQDVIFQCQTESCVFNDITTTMLNGEDVSNLKENLVFLDEDIVLNQPLRVENIVATDINVHGLVDNIDVNTIVTKSGNHHITGHKTFTNTIHAEDLEVHGLVDDVKFAPETVLLKSGYQNITGHLTFSNLTTEWIEINGLVNGHNLNEFYDDVVLKEGNYVITGKKIFQDVSMNNLQMSPGSKINDVDLIDLYQNALWINGSQEITAPLTFSSVTFEKNLYADEVNGIRIPGDRVLLLNENAEISFPQTFVDTTVASHLIVKKSINGINVNEVTGELDLLLKKGNQIITGKKHFTNIVLGGDSFVGGTIDGVDIEALFASSMRRDKPVHSPHTWTFNNVVINGPLHVGGTVSGINISDIYENAVKLTETNLPEFIYQGQVHIKDLQSHNINGIDVSTDLVQVGKKQEIRGVKTFTNIILEEDSHIHGLVNNFNLSFLSDTLLRIGNQVVTSKKIFNGNLKFNHLTVNGRINNVDVNDLITLNGKEDLGVKTFSNLKAHSIKANNMEISGLVNEINISEMIKDTLTYNDPQTITGTKKIVGTLHIANGSNLQTDSLNGLDISALYADAVLVDIPQTIEGRKTFQTPITFEKLWVRDAIDGVTEWEMKNNWMLQGVDQTVEANVNFLGDIEADTVTVNGYINNVDIIKLNETIVKVDEPAFIVGPVIFEGPVKSYGNISLSGKINGIDLSEEAVLKTEETVISGHKMFKGDVIVDGNLFVHGLIDGISVEDLCNKTIRLDQPANINTLTIQGDVTFENGVTVKGNLAGVNITALNLAAVKSEDAETHMNGIKSFETLTIEGNLNVINGKFGGIDIKDLNDNYMSISREQEIKVTHRFEELHVNGAIYSNNLYTNDQMISNINLKELNDTVLRRTGFQTISAVHTFDGVTFDDDVVVVGTVNGIEIPKGVMKRNRVNFINSPKIFEQTVHVLGDLHMDEGRKVQGVDLSLWSKNAVKKNYGTYQIGGNKTFTDITAQDISVKGLLDNTKISEDSLMLSYKDQEVTGKKYIAGNLNINGRLTVGGLINNVNINDLANRAVRKDRDNTITALKTFKQPITIRTLNATTINGINLHDLQEKINDNLDFDNLLNTLLELEDAIAEMKIAVDRQAVILQYYELFQYFIKPMGYVWLYVPTENAEYLLLSDFAGHSDGCTRIYVYKYDDSRSVFKQTSQELLSSKAISMKTVNVWNSTLLVTANSEPKESCYDDLDIMIDSSNNNVGDTLINIYYYSLENKNFIPYQSLKARAAADLAVFEDGDNVCFVYLEMIHSQLYCSYDSLHPFEYVETLHTTGGRKATLIHHDDLIILAIASIDDVKEQSVDIYFWNKEKASFGDTVQVIRSVQPESVLLMKRTSGFITEIFLLVAEGTIPLINNVPRLFIYKYDGKLRIFYKYQEIKDSGELDWTLLPTGELMFFVLDLKTGKIKYYRYKGAAGFVLIDSITSFGTQTIHLFKRNEPQDRLNHYLALAGVQNSAPNAVWNDPYPAKILKSKMQGERTPF